MSADEDPLFSVRDRAVVVTGGLGRLGARFSKALLARGARVAVFDAAAASASARTRFAGVEAQGSLRIEQVDVADRTSIAAALARVRRDWDTPHGLVNAAAIDAPPNAPPEENGPFETYPAESWDRIMAVNVKGVMLACQVIGAAMAEAGRGAIVNISSTYGLVSPDQGLYAYRRARGEIFYKPIAYSASKSALLNLTRYLATYWAGKGVRVNTLTPGGVFDNQDREFVEGYARRVPMGRMAREDEFDGAILFLLSDASSYVTGANLVIDGGFTAW
jgi:Dehydrogenases with different specificities (related to short-chain alcohol dehydrogenases)